MDEKKLQRLETLLDQSKAFSRIVARTLLGEGETGEAGETGETGDESGSPRETGEPPRKKPRTDACYAQPDTVVNVVLKTHQLAGLNWLINLFQNGLNGILADEMGLGKTLQTISLIAFLKEQRVEGPYLVVAPLNVVPNWGGEFARFAPSLSVLSYVGPKAERERLRGRGWASHDVVVTSYELAMVDFDFFKDAPWTYLVVDEGHRLKNFKSQLFSKLKDLNCSNRLLLTGTPLQNNLVELWSLLNFILPSVFHDFHTFKNYFNFEEFEKLKEEDEEENTLINLSMKKALVTNLHTILAPFILRRLKKDVLKLPPKREFIVYSNHTPMQKRLYSALLDTSLSIGVRAGAARAGADRDNAARSLRNTLVLTFLPIYISYNHPHLMKEMPQFLQMLSTQHTTSAKKPLNAIELLMDKATRRNKVDYNEDSRTYGQLSAPKVVSNDLELSPIYPHYLLVQKHFKGKSVLNPLPLLRQVCDSPYILCWPWADEAGDEELAVGSGVDSGVESDVESGQELGDKRLTENINGEEGDTPLNDTHASTPDLYKDLFENTAKLQTLDSLIPEILRKNPTERILVFTQFVKTLQVLRLYFEKHPKLTVTVEGKAVEVFPQSTLMLHGAHSIEQRNDIFAQFALRDQDGNLVGPQIFLLSTKAANLGLNLTVSSTVVLYDCDYNPTVDAQAIARVHRMGQPFPCLIYRLVSKSTVEEVVVRKGEGKTWLADVVVESGNFNGSQKQIPTEASKTDVNLADKDSLLLTLYRLYKLVNRGESNVQFEGNALSPEELAVLTDRDSLSDHDVTANLPRVRMFADPTLDGADDLPDFAS